MPADAFFRAAVLGCLLAAVSIPGSAQVYKWTDSDGRVIVSDSPPPGHTKAQQIRKGVAAETPENAAATADGKPKAEKSDQKNEKTENPEKGDKKAADAASKKILVPAPPDRATCDHARRNLQALESGAQLNTQGPNGERVMMDDATRSREMARVRETLRNCAN